MELGKTFQSFSRGSFDLHKQLNFEINDVHLLGELCQKEDIAN